MGGEDDIARLLPEPPPPRPARRDATIALALQRFDGSDAPAVATPPPRAVPRRWPERRVQIGAFASIALVAAVAVPLALERPDLTHAGSGQPGPIAPSPTAAAQRPSRPPAREAGPASIAVVPARAPAPPSLAKPVTGSSASAVKALPAPAPKAEGAMAEAEPAPAPQIVVTGSRIAQRSESANAVSAITVVTGDTLEDTRDVVVTGTRRARASKAEQRGDWNACTLHDPAQELQRCRQWIHPGKKGEAGVAGAHLADGLTRGWGGDWPGAIAALDEAIALRPHLAIAYLNRGLAQAKKGDLESAVADLDKAVRYAPGAPRNYYNRSLVRRMRGDLRGADADLTRAEALDSRYEGLAD